MLWRELNLVKLKFLSDFGIENAPSFFATILPYISDELEYVKGLGLLSFFSESNPLSFYISLSI